MFEGSLQERWRETITRAWSDRTKENGFTVTEGRAGWDIGKEFLPVTVMRPWYRMPREAVAAPGSLEVSKARLAAIWSSLGKWKVSLSMAGVGLCEL